MGLDPTSTSDMGADQDGSRQKGSADGRAAPRQACIECRRRKIKCSGFGKTGCKTCKAAGVECVFPESQKRGPHKGYFETISTRLSRIERMLQDAIEKQDPEKREASSDEEFPPERKRRRSSKYRRQSHEQINPMAALLAPKSSTAPEIPFHTFVPTVSVSTVHSPLSSPGESALGVLAQVAHELDKPAIPCDENDHSSNPNLLPTDLAESLVQLYFEKVHPLFPIIHKDAFKTAFSQTPKDLPSHLLWAVYLAGSSFSSDHRLQEGPSDRLEIEKHLKRTRDQDLEMGKSSDLSLIQSLLLGELFPAKRERKVALLSWTINGRATKLALKRKLNVDPQRLGFEPDVAQARILTWWCVYIVDIWDAARRGRPPSLHEGGYNIPLPTLSDSPSEEEIYFERLVSITRILSRVLSFGFNDHKTSSSLGTALDISAEETVRHLRMQLSEWYRSLNLPRTSLLARNLEVAYLTTVILLHRPLLPTPLATAFQDPILLLITNCASAIVQIAHATADKVAGSVPWRMFVPAVGYLTAGVTLAQNAAWSTHITGAAILRQSAQRDIKVLLDVFDRAEANGHHTSGMSGLLLSIFQRSEVELNGVADTVIPEIPGTALAMPHEDPTFFATRIRPTLEKPVSLPEKRPSAPMLQPLAPLSLPAPRSHSLSDLPHQKRKHTQISHLSTPTQKPANQQLPSLTSLPGLDSGRRSPTVHSISTYSSHSSNSAGRHPSLYQPVQPPPSTAYHPSYTTPPEPPINRHPPRQYDPARPISPPLPPLYDRRYSEAQSSYPPSSRDYPPTNPYYPREDYYRSASPHQPYARSETTYQRAAVNDPRYRNPTPPLSSAASNSPSWPPGYPYPSQGPPPQRYESNSPRQPLLAAPPNQTRNWPVREEYYYPPRG